MKHLDLFSGYGGFTIPAEKYGIKTVNFSEVDKYANAVLKYRFSDIGNLGDVSQIKKGDVSQPIDIITGGTPCQDLSVAGKGAGLDGARSGLFFHFIRLISEIQPTYFVWENVKGAFSSNKGWDFATVQIEMEQAGYDVWWQLLNAKDFGVPQNRERIFAIGIRKGSGREILFEQRESGQNLEFIGGTGHRKEWLEDGKSKSRNFSQGDRVYSPKGIAPSQNANGGGLGAKTGLYCVGIIPESEKPKGNYLPRERVFDAKGNARAVSTVGSQHPMYAVPNSNGNVHSRDANYWKGSNNPNKSRRSQVVVGNVYKSGGENGKVYDSQGISGTLKSGETSTKGNGGIGSSNSPKILNDMRIRRLTPTECERLMGLEDNWTAKGVVDGEEVGISDTQRYKLCGNGVVVNCVDYIYSLLGEKQC
jgi:DNA (cytosine-5)-methyltransferase 1